MIGTAHHLRKRSW